MSLKVTIIQSELHWEDAAQNLKMFSSKIEKISDATDIIVLPEMFNSGFSMDSIGLSETMEGETVEWMRTEAAKSGSVVTGSLIVEENKEYYNRLVWMQPDGELFTYDKRHLFRMAGEQNHFSAGDKRLIVTYKGWRICPLICYDLRFPVWARNTSNNESPIYDCLIYVANWPEVRKQPWSKLLEARAIENQCYVIGVNRVGKDGNGIPYSGNSVIVDPKGDVISNLKEHEDAAASIEMSLSELNNFREKFPVSLDGDEFTL